MTLMTFKKGHTPWNKGLTKENDDRLNYDRPTTFKKGEYQGHGFKKGYKTWNVDTVGLIKPNKGNFQKDHKINIAEKNGNWKGGITPKNKLLRNSQKWKEWREKVFKRDNYTCQNKNCSFCKNKKGGKLHPHHIKPVSKYPELIFDINNGQTLCEQYHISGGVHKELMKC